MAGRSPSTTQPLQSVVSVHTTATVNPENPLRYVVSEVTSMKRGGETWLYPTSIEPSDIFAVAVSLPKT